MLDLVIVTGASRGIGASISKKCSEIAKEMMLISSSGNSDVSDAQNIKLDLQDYCNTYLVMKDVLSKKQNIKSIGIVLAAAQLGEYGGLLETDLHDWEKIYKINVLGNLAVVKACGDIIKSGAKTRIVFFGGGGAAFPNLEFPNYGATKCAIVREAEALATELSKINDNVSVISLAPGAVATQMLDQVKAHGGEIRTVTDISEPTTFVYRFLIDYFNSKKLNGRFLHVRDDIETMDFEKNKDLCTLRRIQ